MVLGSRQADVNIGSERLRHFFAHQRSDRTSADAADQFAGEKSESVDVIAVRGPRFPPRFLFCECTCNDIPFQRCAVRQ